QLGTSVCSPGACRSRYVKERIEDLRKDGCPCSCFCDSAIAEVAKPLLICGNSSGVLQCLMEAKSLIADDEEGFVLEDRTTDGAANAIGRKWCPRQTLKVVEE